MENVAIISAMYAQKVANQGWFLIVSHYSTILDQPWLSSSIALQMVVKQRLENMGRYHKYGVKMT